MPEANKSNFLPGFVCVFAILILFINDFLPVGKDQTQGSPEEDYRPCILADTKYAGFVRC